MKLTMTEAEMQRAIAKYVAAHMTPAMDWTDLAVRIRWRGKYADVEQKRIPVLTEVVPTPQAAVDRKHSQDHFG